MDFYISEQNRITKLPANSTDRITKRYTYNPSESIARQEGQWFVNNSTPAYTVEFSSSGMAALRSMAQMKKKSEELEQIYDRDINKSSENDDIKNEESKQELTGTRKFQTEKKGVNMLSFTGIGGQGSQVSSLSSSMGDYALIQNGAYKKLLNAYYAKEKGEDKTSKADETAPQEKLKLMTAKSDSENLGKAVRKLTDTEITEENREELKKNISSMVEAYNKVIDSAGAVDDKAVLQNTLWMTQNTKALSKTMQSIGITVGSDNKLKFDEEKFDEAQLNAAKTLFSGNSSLSGKLMQKTDTISRLSATAASDGKSKASAYNKSGNYDNVTTSALYDKLF